MKITRTKLKKNSAAAKFIDWFELEFGEEAELTEVLSRLEEQKKPGQIWLAETFKLSGVYKSWYANGQIRIECAFENGKRHGICRLWNRAGQLTEELTYKNGKRHGQYKYWHPNGQLGVEATFKNGKWHGLYRAWPPEE